MSARSSLCSALVVAAACGPKAPEADPAQVRELAAKVVRNLPPPGVRECKPAELAGLPALTFDTALALAGAPIPEDAEHAAWINPPALDAPAARVLVDGKSDERDKRRAAAQLHAPWLIYRVDLVNAPMALGVKELKIGTVNLRAIRFERDGLPACVKVFYVQNDQAVSDAAIAKSDRPYIDPVIVQALRDDLQQQLLKKVAELVPPAR